MADAPFILVVEDEQAVSSFLVQTLQEAGYRIQAAETLGDARLKLEAQPPSLVLLDVMLPDGNGFEFVEELRRTRRIPVMMLTARDGVGDRVQGLDAGADDYLVKPYELEELLARVRALLRRGAEPQDTFRLGSLEIDYRARRVTRDGRLVFLSTTEYAVLESLSRRAGEAVSKHDLLLQVWDDEERDPNVLEVYINYLRHKLERGGASRLVFTIRGKGYMISDEEPH